MIFPLLAIALFQLTPQPQAKQKGSTEQLNQWVKDHQVELKQQIERIKRINALTYDQALIVYDQCLARSAASLRTTPPDEVFNRALGMCLPLRAELLNGRPPQWFLGFKDLDTAKRAAFPELTKRLRERLQTQAATQETMQVPMRAPSSPPAHAKAPKLAALAAKDAKATLATPQHCELKVGNELRLVASEIGRQAIAMIGGSIRTLRYEGRNPIRYGGRLLISSSASDVWIVVEPRQDESLATGLPRNVTVMINGISGGSDAYSATYTCNY